MAMQFRLDDALTEFDDRVSGELNLDPLGLRIIWSTYGQKIFRNRLNSISNDIRNYTLNLFNHAVTKRLVEDDTVALGRGLSNNEAYKNMGKHSHAFKQACLIYLENVFTYSMVSEQSQPGVETEGVLGISKARRKWSGEGDNPRLLFSHDNTRAHVLMRQSSLGVSGRYKTPLVEMKFFDGDYGYASPGTASQWQKAETELFGKEPLARLRDLACGHLAKLLSDGRSEPELRFDDVPVALKKSFVSAFRSPVDVGMYTRDFWLSITELDQGACGALYNVLEREWHEQAETQQVAVVFSLAAGYAKLTAACKDKLEHVRILEPFLGELDLLLCVMLSAKSLSLDEVVERWKRLGRDGDTLPCRAAPIEADAKVRTQVTGTAAARLDELLDVARVTDVRQQAERLLKYHKKLMESRAQSPWLRLINDSQLKVDVRERQLPKGEERLVGAWVHQYYVPQFRHLLSGLRGKA